MIEWTYKLKLKELQMFAERINVLFIINEHGCVINLKKVRNKVNLTITVIKDDKLFCYKTTTKSVEDTVIKLLKEVSIDVTGETEGYLTSVL